MAREQQSRMPRTFWIPQSVSEHYRRRRRYRVESEAVDFRAPVPETDRFGGNADRIDLEFTRHTAVCTRSNTGTDS